MTQPSWEQIAKAIFVIILISLLGMVKSTSTLYKISVGVLPKNLGQITKVICDVRMHIVCFFRKGECVDSK